MTDREELMERLHKSRMLMGRAAAMDPALGKIEQDLYEAIAALQQESPRVVVKPLEWEGSKRTSRTKEESDWWATSSVSDYWIERTAKRFRLTFNGSQLGGLYLTLDEAKAAAQADYEQRILSALAYPLHQPAPEAGIDAYKRKNAATGWTGRHFSFEGGSLLIDKEGNGKFIFAEEELSWEEPDDENPRQYRSASVAASELIALASYLAKTFPAPAPEPQAPAAISPSDPLMILAGIRQFGLAADGSDLRDIESALLAECRLVDKGIAAVEELMQELDAERQAREAAEHDRDAARAQLSDPETVTITADRYRKYQEAEDRAEAAEASLAKAEARIAELEAAFLDIAHFTPDAATGVDQFEQITRHARATTLAVLSSINKEP